MLKEQSGSDDLLGTGVTTSVAVKVSFEDAGLVTVVREPFVNPAHCNISGCDVRHASTVGTGLV